MRNKKIIFILILMSGLIFSTHITYARYIKTEMFNAVQEIAIPVLEIEEGETIKIDKTNNVGFYNFSIKNFNSKNISDVDLKYTIKIISDVKENVQFELYDEEKQIGLESLKTEELLIKGNKKIEKNYKLKIIYNNINESESNKLKNVQIEIHSEQEKI